MRFRCPGCGKRHPLAAGHLVIDQPAALRVTTRAGGWRNAAESTAAILCAPCIGSILADRAKVR